MPDTFVLVGVVTAVTYALLIAGVALLALRLVRRGRWRVDLILAGAVLVVSFAIGWWRVQQAQQQLLAPPGSMQITAVARDGHWWFTHPGQSGATRDECWVEVDRPAMLTVRNETAVAFDIYVPSMRIRRQALPDRLQTVWFQPTECGDYHVFAAAIAGATGVDAARPETATLHIVRSEQWARAPWR